MKFVSHFVIGLSEEKIKLYPSLKKGALVGKMVNLGGECRRQSTAGIIALCYHTWLLHLIASLI